MAFARFTRESVSSRHKIARSSSKEVRISWYTTFSFLVYFSRGTLPTKKETVKGLGDVEKESVVQ